MELLSRMFIERAMKKEMLKEHASEIAKECLRNGISLDTLESSIKLLTREELEALRAETIQPA